MPEVVFAAAVSDPRGHLADKLDELLPGLRERFGTLAVHATTSTHRDVLEPLESAGAGLVTSPADIDAIGRHRREAVALALRTGAAGHVLYLDLDHALRWLENDADGLDDAVRRMRRSDCTVVGRGPRAMAALPRCLAATEGAVNEMFRLVSGLPWDVMMAARGLSRRAAGAIVEGCAVDTIGNDCAWPLFCRSRGLALDYLETKALTYRTEADYAAGAEDEHDSDPLAWALRIKLAAQHAEAMRPYMRPDWPNHHTAIGLSWPGRPRAREPARRGSVAPPSVLSWKRGT